MPVGAYAVERDVELDTGELGRVGGGRLVAAELRRHRVPDRTGRLQMGGGEAVVGLLVVERHAALVAVPQVHVAPVGQLRPDQLVGAPDGRAAAEGDVGGAAHVARRVERGGDDLCGPARGPLGVGAPAHDWLAHVAGIPPGGE